MEQKISCYPIDQKYHFDDSIKIIKSHCTFTITFSQSYRRVFIIVLSYYCVFVIVLSYCRVIVIVLSRFHYRTSTIALYASTRLLGTTSTLRTYEDRASAGATVQLRYTLPVRARIVDGATRERTVSLALALALRISACIVPIFTTMQVPCTRRRNI